MFSKHIRNGFSGPPVESLSQVLTSYVRTCVRIIYPLAEVMYLVPFSVLRLCILNTKGILRGYSTSRCQVVYTREHCRQVIQLLLYGTATTHNGGGKTFLALA